LAGAHLYGLDEIDSPVGKIIRFLENYRDRYLIDCDNFPGGCVFVTLSVELDDQRPYLSKKVNDGFEGVKHMIKRYLEDGKAIGELKSDLDTDIITQMIFAGMIGASVTYGVEKSTQSLDKVISSLIQFIDMVRIPKQQS
jgi:hypothetical protein